MGGQPVAEELGVDGKTVGSVRDDLESDFAEIPKLDRLVGKDGKARRRRKAKPATPKQEADDDVDDDDDMLDMFFKRNSVILGTSGPIR